MHYIALIERKPGALRNGAPFETLPEPLKKLQAILLRHEGGDRVMAQVLAAVPVHGLEPVLVAACMWDPTAKRWMRPGTRNPR